MEVSPLPPSGESHSPILLDDLNTANALQISLEDVDWLVATRQLNPIFIRRKRRFLRVELETLAKLYQSTQSRNPHAYDSNTKETDKIHDITADE